MAEQETRIGEVDQAIEHSTEWFEVRNSPIHGRGAFARVDIPAGKRITEYVGEKITKEESNRRCEAQNAYIFSISASMMSMTWMAASSGTWRDSSTTVVPPTANQNKRGTGFGSWRRAVFGAGKRSATITATT